MCNMPYRLWAHPELLHWHNTNEICHENRAWEIVVLLHSRAQLSACSAVTLFEATDVSEVDKRRDHNAREHA